MIGYIFLFVFWALALGAILVVFPKRSTVLSFLVSERNVGFSLGAVSTAVAWVWAGALFLSSQKAYQQGIPGLVWFAAPNALALVLISFLVARMHQVFKKGFTLPEFMGKRLDQRARVLYIVAIFVSQSYAVIFNLTAALLMLNFVTGIAKPNLILILGGMIVSLSLLKGMRSSLVEDVLKAVLIGIVIFVIVPVVIMKAGGISVLADGLGGVKGTFTNLFDPMVAWTFGVQISISLLSGVVIDQQQWQRAFSMRTNVARKAFLFGGFLFLLVPVMLGLLGYIAASPAAGITVLPKQEQLAGFNVVMHLFSGMGTLAFTAMVLAGLVAAGSSALAAVSLIGAIDVYRIWNPAASDRQLLVASRIAMILLALFGMAIALIPNIQLLYLILMVGAFRAALLVPTILALFWPRLSAVPTFWGILLGMLAGVPLFVYGSIVNIPTISSFGSLVPILITVVFCVGGSFIKSKKFDYNLLASGSEKI